MNETVLSDKYPVIIKEHHLDSFGHVNNATYLELFEEARWEMVTRRGCGLEEVKKTKLGPIILELKLRFVREIVLRQKIEIETSCVSCHGKVGILTQKMVGGTGEVFCEAEFKMGLFDLEKRRLVAVTPEWVRAFGFQLGHF